MKRLLSVSDAAELVGVTTRTIRNWLRKGDLQAVRLGRLVRIHPDDLTAFLDAARGCSRVTTDDRTPGLGAEEDAVA